MGILLTEWCNIFGVETGGANKMLGGLSKSKPNVQFYCPRRSIGRYYMVCEHGHRGQEMPLCHTHRVEFGNSVTFCPRCNAEPPGHKCNLRLVEKS